nr:WhiB family transcriptional regulator [Rhodococcus sp. 14C212]
MKLLTLPPAVAESWDWQLEAACRDRDAALFFHPDNERGDARDDRIAAAKEVCRTCPVQAQCLRHALRTREPYGIWGGTTEDERRAARSRGRAGSLSL